MSIKPVKIPGVGMRNVKTALAAAFCALAYYFIGRSPAFACIGAIFGMGSDMEDSRKNGGNRLFGTLIGGLLGTAKSGVPMNTILKRYSSVSSPSSSNSSRDMISTYSWPLR